MKLKSVKQLKIRKFIQGKIRWRSAEERRKKRKVLICRQLKKNILPQLPSWIHLHAGANVTNPSGNDKWKREQVLVFQIFLTFHFFSSYLHEPITDSSSSLLSHPAPRATSSCSSSLSHCTLTLIWPSLGVSFPRSTSHFPCQCVLSIGTTVCLTVPSSGMLSNVNSSWLGLIPKEISPEADLPLGSIQRHPMSCHWWLATHHLLNWKEFITAGESCCRWSFFFFSSSLDDFSGPNELVLSLSWEDPRGTHRSEDRWIALSGAATGHL